jgi:hypothetical protein
MFPALPRLMWCLLLALPISGCGKKEPAAAKESHNGMKPLSERVKERKARGKGQAAKEQTEAPDQTEGPRDLRVEHAEFEKAFAGLPGETPAEGLHGDTSWRSSMRAGTG